MTTRRPPKVRRDFCPSCGRLTAYRLAWTQVGTTRPPRVFRPHNDREGKACPVRETSARLPSDGEGWAP